MIEGILSFVLLEGLFTLRLQATSTTVQKVMGPETCILSVREERRKPVTKDRPGKSKALQAPSSDQQPYTVNSLGGLQISGHAGSDSLPRTRRTHLTRKR